MEILKDNLKNSEMLARALRTNGLLHQNYKVYMPMDRALGLLLSGNLYISDGSRWNDTEDRELMKTKGVYGYSFSFSTSENIAMWMLYGGDGGKNGAMINFYPTIISEICDTSEIELGRFQNGSFDTKYKLERKTYEIFMTDMLYIEKCKDSKVRISVAEQHSTVAEEIIKHRDIFYKKYPWSYEKECRLVVRINDEWQRIIKNEDIHVVKIKIGENGLRRLRMNRLVKSPIYNNRVDIGISSNLYGSVDWNI